MQEIHLYRIFSHYFYFHFREDSEKMIQVKLLLQILETESISGWAIGFEIDLHALGTLNPSRKHWTYFELVNPA
jgi:hypothetical protein